MDYRNVFSRSWYQKTNFSKCTYTYEYITVNLKQNKTIQNIALELSVCSGASKFLLCEGWILANKKEKEEMWENKKKYVEKNKEIRKANKKWKAMRKKRIVVLRGE